MQQRSYCALVLYLGFCIHFNIEKNPTEDNNQRDLFLLKFGLSLLLRKVVCFYAMTDEKQLLAINLIGVILICVIDTRDSTFITNMRQI